MKSKELGLYVHIPFCLHKCNYCDFCSFSDIGEDVRKQYIDRLCEEIQTYRNKTEEYHVVSIFFGGGTPSLLSPEEFSKITKTLHETFSIPENIEFTVEANPKTLTEEKVKNFVSCGVNRLSIGLQSIHENEMKILGRIHNFDDFSYSLELVRKCGIANINVDIMYAIPEQTPESFMRTVDFVSSLPITHISAYSLIVEENTPFGKMQKSLILPSEDDEIFMLDYLRRTLKTKGFVHYEISNYQKGNHPSRHNLLYWNGDDYLGFGISAYSCFSDVRFANSSLMDEYLSEDYIQYRTDEHLTENDRAFEYAMLRLRLAEGLSLSEYERRFHKSFFLENEEYIAKCIDLGYIRIMGDFLSLTEDGMYVSNEILAHLL